VSLGFVMLTIARSEIADLGMICIRQHTSAYVSIRSDIVDFGIICKDKSLSAQLKHCFPAAFLLLYFTTNNSQS